MKKQGVTAVVVLSVCTALTGILTLFGVLLLPAVLEGPATTAQESVSGIEYSALPENKSILITGEKGEGILINLNFEEIVTNIYIFDKDAQERAQDTGYIIDYTMAVDNNFLLAFCDRMGGIELEKDGSKERYLSAALENFVSGGLNEEKMLQICDSFFEKFSKSGLSSGDFMFIIENSDTNLNYPICYDWIDYIPEMFCNCVYQ